MSLLGRTEVLIPVSALRLLLDQCQLQQPLQQQRPSIEAEISCKESRGEPKSTASHRPRDIVVIEDDGQPPQPSDPGPSRRNPCCYEEEGAGFGKEVDSGAVDALWEARRREAEAQAEVRGRALHQAWQRDRKSLEQAIDESLAEHQGLREKAHALRLHFDQHRARWEVAARWRLLEELRRGAALSPAAALRHEPLWAHGKGPTSTSMLYAAPAATNTNTNTSTSTSSTTVEDGAMDITAAAEGEDFFLYDTTSAQEEGGQQRKHQQQQLSTSTGIGTTTTITGGVVGGYEGVVSEGIRKKRRFNLPAALPTSTTNSATNTTETAATPDSTATHTTTSVVVVVSDDDAHGGKHSVASLTCPASTSTIDGNGEEAGTTTTSTTTTAATDDDCVDCITTTTMSAAADPVACPQDVCVTMEEYM